MSTSDARITVLGAEIHLRLSDFNRLRWTVAALRMNPQAVAGPPAGGPAPATVIDSLALHGAGAAVLAPGTHIVLWDGLNSLGELWAAQPALKDRPDIGYLYVGSFAEVRVGFAPRSGPLFPAALPTLAERGRAGVTVPRWLETRGWLRARLRPIKNLHLAPGPHRRLRHGRHAVFCGLVRPSTAVLDGFFRGTTLGATRRRLQPLVGIDWRAAPAAVEAGARAAFDALRRAEPQSPPDFAALYASANLLHRLATLAQLASATERLLVNEFGVHAHLDPYDTPAYANNLFLDFGSSRGPDAVYPRTVDLWLNRKRSHPMRLIEPQQSLADFLKAHDEAAFWKLCAAHGEAIVQALHRPEEPAARALP